MQWIGSLSNRQNPRLKNKSQSRAAGAGWAAHLGNLLDYLVHLRGTQTNGQPAPLLTGWTHRKMVASCGLFGPGWAKPDLGSPAMFNLGMRREWSEGAGGEKRTVGGGVTRTSWQPGLGQTPATSIVLHTAVLKCQSRPGSHLRQRDKGFLLHLSK